MIKKLRVKFVVIIMVIVTVMLSVIFGMLYSSMRQNLEGRAIAMLRAIASEPFRVERPKGLGGKYLLPYFVLQLDHGGELISTGGGFYDLSDKDFLGELIKAVDESDQEMGVLSEYHLRYCQKSSLRGRVIAFCDMGNEKNVLSGMFRILSIVGGLSFLIFLGISILFSRWAVKPVEKAWKDQKQFVADASHELKTPLTVIMTNAELLQSPDFDADSQRQFLDSIVVMAGQMRSLVEKMLELARADNQTQRVGLSEVNLSRLSEDVALSFEGVFYEKGLQLTTNIAPGVFVRGNPEEMQQVLDILLDNAQKYSSPGGETTVTLTTVHGKCRLSVSNPGEGIPPADLKKIFGRFYRMDGARSRDGSFGLGLAIAQQIVSQHHGKLWAESSKGRNTFTVEFPIKKERADV